ncbi:hypothetical protein ABTZ03_36835 [Kitasatospora sp. NPDC096077]|uniref:hypothetical protein n=1 Tax=Kitasatospora sp. NPDC096077 TaxID=3155544 RepID=UPI003322CA5B
MRASHKAAGIAAAAALAVGGIACQVAAADTPVTVRVNHFEADCAVTWAKDGVSLRPTIPGTGPSSYALTDGEGTVTFDLGSLNNPVALANSINARGTFHGGFLLVDRAGHFVEAVDGEGTLPTGEPALYVRTDADPVARPTPVVTYAEVPLLVPTVSPLDPFELTVRVPQAKFDITPEFAKVLNDTFGTGSAQPGTPWATCSGSITT